MKYIRGHSEVMGHATQILFRAFAFAASVIWGCSRTQVERRELLAPRGDRHHRRVGDLAASTQVERRELLGSDGTCII